MPGKISYPVGADAEQAIEGLGLLSGDDLTRFFEFHDMDTLADAAVRQFEEETGWIPFLADAAAVTRYFDPQGANRSPHTLGGGYPLELDTGLVALTSILTGVTATSTGTTRVLDTDFWLTPYNADELGRPWTAIEFVVPQWGARRSIKITGRFGYAGTVPDDVWQAITHHAAWMALPELAITVSGGVRRFTEAGVTEEYGPGFLTGGGTGAEAGGGIGGAWAKEWARVISRYRRVVV